MSRLAAAEDSLNPSEKSREDATGESKHLLLLCCLLDLFARMRCFPVEVSGRRAWLGSGSNVAPFEGGRGMIDMIELVQEMSGRSAHLEYPDD